MTKFAIVAAVAVLLSGCAAAMQHAAVQDCENYGFSPGTQLFLSCVETEIAQRQNAIRANNQLIMEGAAMMNGGPTVSVIAP